MSSGPIYSTSEKVSWNNPLNSILFQISSSGFCLSLRCLQWHPTPVLLPGKSHGRRNLVGCSPWGHYKSDKTERLHITFHFHALEKEMATHSSVLAWRIPGMAEPGGLLSMGSHRVEHDWRDLAAAAAETRGWQTKAHGSNPVPTPTPLPTPL